MVSRSVLKPDKGKNADFWLKQTWRLDIVHYIRIWSSRTGNVLHALLRANIQELTFHQTNYCGSLQTIRWFRRSDLVVIPPLSLRKGSSFRILFIREYPLKAAKQLCIIKNLQNFLFWRFLLWRSGRDSNPCAGISPPNDLANRPLRPLEYHSTN